MLRTSYVRISELEEPDTRLRSNTPSPLNLGSGDAPGKIVQHPGARTNELGSFSGFGLQIGLGFGFKTTHPPQAIFAKQFRPAGYMRPHVRTAVVLGNSPSLLARFLLIKDKIKDCRDEDTILVFCNNCTDEGILNAINRHRVLHFADLATVVQKYYAMESAWKTQTA